MFLQPEFSQVPRFTLRQIATAEGAEFANVWRMTTNIQAGRFHSLEVAFGVTLQDLIAKI